MKLSINTKHPNYAAKVVKISQLEKHPNADRLQLAVIDFQRIITGLETKEGDLFIHFPAESQINQKFLSFENAFRKKELNEDKTGEKVGFFEEKGRVKSIKLRGIISEGYLHPVERVNAWLEHLGTSEKITEDDLGKEFDTISAKGIDDVFFTKKYFVKKKDGTQKGSGGPSRIIDNQFALHGETAQIKRNMGRIFPDQTISISYKLHGCLDRETVLQTKDHGHLTIGEIVEQQIKCEVLSRDLNKGENVYSPVDDFHLQEDTDDWYEVELEDGTVLEVTGNHPIWLPDCEYYGKVENLKEGDFVLKC